MKRMIIMAQRVSIDLVDDVDQTPAVETLSFALDGVSYEIDLSSDNATRLRDGLAMWVGHARRIGGRRTVAKKAKPGAANDIRAWAIAQGMHVSSRGRVSAEVREAYEKANS